MAEAYQIQDLAMSQMAGLAGGLEDWLNFGGPATAGEPGWLVCPIWSRQCHLGQEHLFPVEVGIFTSGFAAVEAELVIRLGQDLPAHDGGGWTAEEAADLEQHCRVEVGVDRLWNFGPPTPARWCAAEPAWRAV